MSLLDYLPAIYQDPDDTGAPSGEAIFLRQFLLAFESVMLSGASGYRPGGRGGPGAPGDGPPAGGGDAGAQPGQLFAWSGDRGGRGRGPSGANPSIEDEIAGLHLLFDPEETPEEFLEWLSGWVGLAWRPDLSPARQRRILANAVRLYRIRGTRLGLEESLRLYLDALPSVDDEDLPPLQIAVHSTVGQDTWVGGGASFLFQVTLAFSREDPAFVEQQMRLAREVIELGRPAHTRYALRTVYPKFRLGVHSTVGVDTVVAP